MAVNSRDAGLAFISVMTGAEPLLLTNCMRADVLVAGLPKVKT